MKKTNEKGVTLVALVITVIVLLILASIGTNAGKGTIELAKYDKLRNEITMIQTKVNELNQEDKTEIGEKISNTQKNILNTSVVSNIIYSGRTDDEKKEIEDGFRFCSSDYLEKQFELDGIDRNYLINVEYRYVVSCEGVNYKGTMYYMIDQMDNGLYNVEYHNKNSNDGSNDGSFDVDVKTDGDIYKIVVSNINHDGYVANWQVKYKLNTDEVWKVSNQLEFVVDKAGTYIVNLVHGDEIDLGRKRVVVSNKLGWNQNKSVNYPKLMQGMSAIKFTDPTDSKEGEIVKTSNSDVNWYNYDNQKWANAQTEDGSMWVWIPRYAYKVNSDTQKCDVVFLIGTTDNYYDKDGKLQTAKRQTTTDELIDTKKEYTVHPAFTDESSIQFTNGGWREELTGIWVSKFEAGYFNKTTEQDKIKASNVFYNQTQIYVVNKWSSPRNYLEGSYTPGTTAIKYPTFQGQRYSMNYTSTGESFSISRALTDKGNVYGLNSKLTDSHMIKNSEWGAIAYLSQSKYGLNGINIRINNVNLNGSVSDVYAVTGYAAKTEDAQGVGTSEAYTWKQKNGQKASSSGTIYGIYDLSGGIWERTASIINNGNSALNKNAKEIIDTLKEGKSTEYVMIYSHDTAKDNIGITSNDITFKEAQIANYTKNTKYGDAIKETSTNGVNSNSWYKDGSYFFGLNYPISGRGGAFWATSDAGLFYYRGFGGGPSYDSGFRCVLVSL